MKARLLLLALAALMAGCDSKPANALMLCTLKGEAYMGFPMAKVYLRRMPDADAACKKAMTP